MAANPTATTTDATATQPADASTKKLAPVTNTTPASSSATSASVESPVTGTDATTNNVSDVSAPQTASTPNATSTAPQTPTANTASAVSPGTITPTVPVSAISPAPAQSVTTTPQTVAKPDVTVQGQGQNYGWQNPVHENETAGVTGQALRLEGVKITVNNTSNTYPGDIVYQAHVSGTGWQSEVKNGALAGTVGQSKRLEGIKIYIDNNGLTGDVVYQAHVSGTGWQNAVTDGQLAGTVGQSRQMEAIKVTLTGQLASYYNLYYRVHIQDVGWLAWTANDGIAGSTGLAKRIEAIQLTLIQKGHAVPQTGTAYLNPTNYQVVTKHANQPVYFSQLDSRWANHPFNDYTMGPAGCVPTSIAMVLNGSYGIPVNPDNVRAVMNNISTSSYGATGIDLINTVHYYGRQVEQINTVARTAQLLQQGVPVIFYVNVANGIGHAIATYGYSNGATQVYDPYSRYYFNGWYDLNYLSNTLSRDPSDWNAGRPVFAIM
ncbi:C39 family peptidase [Leuconostoc lactis]|uniref:C39 family peptidase n=1 Tax=Leuconostoc lactis TaxID=1246 RepID=UPI0024ADFECA|nr:C39 family peptidase [Leuconostoc lactis]MDI6495659.1 C39 family peptidase [Leuconostoc lactis]